MRQKPCIYPNTCKTHVAQLAMYSKLIFLPKAYAGHMFCLSPSYLCKVCFCVLGTCQKEQVIKFHDVVELFFNVLDVGHHSHVYMSTSMHLPMYFTNYGRLFISDKSKVLNNSCLLGFSGNIIILITNIYLYIINHDL